MKTLTALAACAVLTVLLCVSPAQAAFPGQNGKIVFVSARDGNQELYTMNPDGRGQTRLTATDAHESLPAWSADGQRIAFDRYRPDGGSDVWVMAADGSGERRLTDEPGVTSAEPAWSPDGNRIAFTRKVGPLVEVYAMNADGTGLVNLSDSPSTDDVQPAWSPDGTIAFVRWDFSFRTAQSHIYTMNADGSNQVDVSGPFEAEDYSPNWSPDGSQIAFMNSCCRGVYGIYVMNADGSGARQLLSADDHPAWSPDGTRLAFNSKCLQGCVDEDVYTVSPDGSGLAQLTANDAYEGLADWQPITGPRRSDFKNAAHFCKAEREFLGDDEFRARYGGGANAHGRCVNRN